MEKQVQERRVGVDQWGFPWFGEQIRARREEHGRTLREVAEITGISASTICRIENGGDALVSNYAKLASVLGMNSTLLSVTVNPEVDVEI